MWSLISTYFGTCYYLVTSARSNPLHKTLFNQAILFLARQINAASCLYLYIPRIAQQLHHTSLRLLLLPMAADVYSYLQTSTCGYVSCVYVPYVNLITIYLALCLILLPNKRCNFRTTWWHSALFQMTISIFNYFFNIHCWLPKTEFLGMCIHKCRVLQCRLPYLFCRMF